MRRRFQTRARPSPAPSHRLAVHEKRVHQLIFATEDSFITAGEDSQLLQIGIDGRVVRAFDGHHGHPINCLAAIDHERFATGSDDGKVRVWNLDGSCEAVLEGHEAFVRSVAARGDRLVSAAEDQTVRFWDLSRRELLREEPLPEEPTAIAISPAAVVVATLDNGLLRFDLKTGEPRDPIYASGSHVVRAGRTYLPVSNTSGIGHRRPPRALWFTENGVLLSVSEELIAWHPDGTHRVLRSFAWPVEGITGAQERIWIAARDLVELDVDGNLLGWLPAANRWASAIAVSSDYVVCADDNGVIEIYPTAAISRDLARHRVAPSSSLVLSRDGTLAATNDMDNTRLIWSTETGDTIAVIEEPSANGCPTVFTCDNTLLTASHSPASTLTLRRLDGTVVRSLDLSQEDAGRHCPEAMLQLSDGSLLVGMLGDNLLAWDRDFANRRTFDGRTSQISVICPAPGEQLAVTVGYFPGDKSAPLDAGFDHSSPQLQCWDPARGELLWTISAGWAPGERLPCDFEPVLVCELGVLARSGDSDDQLALRDLQTGEERWRLPAGAPLAMQVDGDRLSLIADPAEGPPVLHSIDLKEGRFLRSIVLPSCDANQAVFVGPHLAMRCGETLLVVDREGVLLEQVTDLPLVTIAAHERMLVAATKDSRIVVFVMD